MASNARTQRHRGRPARSDIDTLKTKVWFMQAGYFLGSYSGYAFEKRFSPKKTVPSGGITKRTCKFDKYKRGEHTPSKNVIDAVDKAFPGTKSIIEHPLWEVARCPCTDIDSLYIQLQRLRPELVNLLFRHEQKGLVTYQRRSRSYMTTFESLVKEGDLEALTACIGLVQEAKYYGDDIIMDFIFTRPTFTVFRRSISQSPYYYVVDEFYSYLMKNILNTPIGQEIQESLPTDIVGDLASLSNTRLLIIEDFDLLKHYYFAPRSCLHIAETYLTATVLKKIWDMIVSGNPSDVYRLPEIRKLSRALKRWEKKHMPTTTH